jgi:hypothetical protein
MQRITSTIIFMLIIINTINKFFILGRSVEQRVIYESPPIIIVFSNALYVYE